MNVQRQSSGKATINKAKQATTTSIKVRFTAPVNRIYVKKENFTIERVEIIKAKFAVDMANVELITSPLEFNKPYMILFKAPGQESTHKVKVE